MDAPPPETAQELRDWFRDLKDASGLSYAEIARAIEEEERNVKRWMTGPKVVLPRGDVVLRLLYTLGVRFTPPAPGSVTGVNAQIAELRELLGAATALLDQQALRAEAEAGAGASTEDLADRLLALEARVGEQSESTVRAVTALAKEVRALARQQARPEPEASRKPA